MLADRALHNTAQHAKGIIAHCDYLTRNSLTVTSSAVHDGDQVVIQVAVRAVNRGVCVTITEETRARLEALRSKKPQRTAVKKRLCQ